MNALLHFFSIPHQMKRREELYAEGKIHDFRRMSVSRCKVDQPPLCQEIETAPIRLDELPDILAYDFIGCRALGQLRNVDLNIEVSGVRHHSSVLHHVEVTLAEDVLISRKRQEDVAHLCRLVHRHDIEAVKDRLNRLDGIDFRDDNICAKSACTHRSALAAPSVSCDNDRLPRYDEVRRTHDAVPCGLPRPIAVVKEILAVCVICRNHRELKLALTLQRL